MIEGYSINANDETILLLFKIYRATLFEDATF